MAITATASAGIASGIRRARASPFERVQRFEDSHTLSMEYGNDWWFQFTGAPSQR